MNSACARESILVLERVVDLCVGHGSGLEPAVENLGDALHHAATFGACPRDRIDEVAVQVVQPNSGTLVQLVDGPDALGVIASVATQEGTNPSSGFG